MPLTGIKDFEKKNNVSINVLGYFNEPFPLHISKNRETSTLTNTSIYCLSAIATKVQRIPPGATGTTVSYKI